MILNSRCKGRLHRHPAIGIPAFLQAKLRDHYQETASGFPRIQELTDNWAKPSPNVVVGAQRTAMDKDEARAFLASLLNKNLRIVATDGRMFLGQFKCTDPVGFHRPSRAFPVCAIHFVPYAGASVLLLEAREKARRVKCLVLTCCLQDENVILANTYEYRQPSAKEQAEAAKAAATSGGTVKMDMTSRYLGLVVVPGQHIVKIEVEEFASQLNGKNPYEEAVVV